MTWFAVAASVAGPLVSGMMQSDSAGEALQSQEAGAARSDATQRYIYDTSRADNAPFQQTGVAANNRLAQLMGLGGGGAMTREQIRAQLSGQFARGGGGASSGTPLPASIAGLPYVTQAGYDYFRQANPQDADNIAAYLTSGGKTEGSEGASGQAMPVQAPEWFRFGARQSGQGDEAGLNAAVEAQFAQQQRDQATAESDPAYGSMMRNFSAQDLRDDPVLNASEGYMQPMRDFQKSDLDGDVVYQNGLQYGLDEGRRGIENMGAATGSALSGNTLRALTRFGNDFATKRTGDAYDRFNTNQNYKYGLRVDSNNRFGINRDAKFNKLSALSGTGQVAAGQVGAAGQNYGNSLSRTAQELGTAQGAAAIAKGNALSGGINGAVSAWGNRGGSGVGGFGSDTRWSGGSYKVPTYPGAEY